MKVASDFKANTVVPACEIRSSIGQSLALALSLWKILFLNTVPQLMFSQDPFCEYTSSESLQRNGKFHRTVTSASDRFMRLCISQSHITVVSLKCWTTRIAQKIFFLPDSRFKWPFTNASDTHPPLASRTVHLLAIVTCTGFPLAKINVLLDKVNLK